MFTRTDKNLALAVKKLEKKQQAEDKKQKQENNNDKY